MRFIQQHMRFIHLGIVVAVLLTAYLTTLAPGLTWANRGEDGGDLISAAATGGVAHPTGYPAYLILARLFLQLPFGSPAWRINLLSAVAAVGAAVVIQQAIICLQQSRVSYFSATLAALGLGLSPLLWSQAVIAEVYSLHALSLSVIVLAWVRLTTLPARTWLDVALAFLAGASLGNHATTALALIPYALMLLRFYDRRALAALVLGAVGVYARVPFWAAQQAPINWGGAATWAGWSWLVSAQLYRNLVFALPIIEWPPRLQNLLHELGGLGALAFILGAFSARRDWPRALQAMTLWMFCAYALFALSYGAPDYKVLLMPVWVGAALVVAEGWRWVLAHTPQRWRWSIVIFAGAWLLWRGVLMAPQVSARTDAAAEAFIADVNLLAPAHALLETQTDRDTFALWYSHFVLHQRSDVVIIARPLWRYAWYQDSLRAAYPELIIPSVTSSIEDVARANQRLRCVPRFAPTALLCEP